MQVKLSPGAGDCTKARPEPPPPMRAPAGKLETPGNLLTCFSSVEKKRIGGLGAAGGVGQFPVQKNPKLRNSALLTVKTNKQKAFIQKPHNCKGKERKEKTEGGCRGRR